MAVVNLTALISNVNRLYNPAIFQDPSGKIPTCAPYVFVDSASPLGALPAFPLSTAVVVGNKFKYGADATHPYLYWECTTAGNTGSSQPAISNVALIGELVNSNVANFRVRRYHGWSRALNALAANVLNRVQITNLSTSPTVAWTAIIASSHAQVVSIQFSLTLCPAFSQSASNVPGYTLVSVDKSTATPTTFSAGASVIGTLDTSGMLPITDPSSRSGMVRGLTLGHDNTATTANAFVDQYTWNVQIRFYDCVFQSFRTNQAAGSSSDEGAHSGARHSVRCSYRSLHATTPSPALLSTQTMTIIEAGSISRLVSATTPVIRASANNTPTGGDVFLLGVDLSTFTGGVVYKGEAASNGALQVRFGPPTLRTLGSPMAAAAFTQPSIPPVDVGFGMFNTTVMGEWHSRNPQVGSPRWGFQNTAPAAYTAPSVSRENTIVRSGGASDALGSYSLKTTIRDIQEYPHFFEFWNSKIDESFLITIEFQWSNTGSGLTLLSKEDVWLEAAYLTDTGVKNTADLVFSFNRYNRRGLIYNDATGPDMLPTSAATWGGALGGAIKQSVSVIVTPKKVGPIKVWLGLWLTPWMRNISTLTSIPIYIDPLPTLSAAP